jgi:hypothetical protein
MRERPIRLLSGSGQRGKASVGVNQCLSAVKYVSVFPKIPVVSAVVKEVSGFEFRAQSRKMDSRLRHAGMTTEKSLSKLVRPIVARLPRRAEGKSESD